MSGNNIGPREREHRRVMGLLSGAVTCGFAVWALASGYSRPRRLLVFVPAAMAAVGLLQARAGTCVALAACGLRNLDAGSEYVEDPEELRAARHHARRIGFQAATLAAGVTALVAALPAPFQVAQGSPERRMLSEAPRETPA